MSRVKSLIELEMDRRTALELADQYYAEAKSIQKEIDALFINAREECGKTGQTIYKYFEVEE